MQQPHYALVKLLVSGQRDAQQLEEAGFTLSL